MELDIEMKHIYEKLEYISDCHEWINQWIHTVDSMNLDGRHVDIEGHRQILNMFIKIHIEHYVDK